MFRKVIVILFFFFFVTGCKTKTTDELLTEGMKFMNENKPNGAIVLFKNALKRDQNSFDARFQLAKAYAAIGKFEHAEQELNKVLRMNPSSGDIRLELGKLYVSTNRPDKAIDEMKNHLKLHMNNPEAFEIMGHSFVIKKRSDKAERYYREALNLEPNRHSAKLGLAGVYTRRGENREAKKLIEDVIKEEKNNTKAYYMLASIEKESGNSVNALKAYKRIAEINSSDINALFRAGLLHIDIGELSEAEKIADDLLNRFPKFSEGDRLKGFVYFYKGSFNEAIVMLQSSLKKQPNMGTYYFLGLSHYSQGELEQALSQFHKVLDMNPSFIQARLLIALILLKQERVDDSITEAKRILQQDEGNALAHNILGSAYMTKGMYGEAMQELTIATELDPKLIDAHLKKGLYSLTEGKVKEAETELKTAVKIGPEILNTRLILASYYVKRKEYKKAVITLKEGISGKKSDAVLYNYMAASLFAEKKPAAALDYLRKAKNANPDYFAPHLNIATYYTLKGDYEKSIEEYKEVLKRDSKNIRVLVSMAATFELLSRDDEALVYFKKAKETESPDGFLALASYLLRKKEVNKAFGVLDEAIHVDPGNIKAIELKGKMYLYGKRYKEAVKMFEELEALNPEKGLPLIINAYIQGSDYKGALAKLKERLETEPDRLDMLAEITRIYILMGDVQKAIETANEIVKKKPASAYGYIVLAQVYESQNDIERAVDLIKKGLEIDEKNVKAWMMLGYLYTRKSEYTHAIGTYEDIVKNNPLYIPAIFAQGIAYDQMGNKKEAVRKYRHLLDRSENYVPALNNLAYLYIEGYGSNEEALELAIRAYRLSPANANVMDTLGYVLLRNGRKDDAMKMLEKAVALLSHNPSVHYHLAIAYKENNEIEKSIKHFELAIAKGYFPELAEAKRVLNEIKR